MMQEDKAALLRALTIDRTRPPARRGVPWKTVAAGLATGCIVAAGAYWYVIDGQPPARTAERAPAKAPPAAAPRSEPARPEPVRSEPATTTAQARPATPPPATVSAPAAAPAAAPARAGSLVASGYIVARRKATVAAEITGRIVDVLVEEGMRVEEGQVLARLDAALAEIDLSLARAAVDQAQATVAGHQADLRDAESTLKRVRSLSRNANASEADLIKAQARVDSLRAQIRAAEAQIETAKLDVSRRAEQLSKYTIAAPFSGVVIDKNAQPGEIISPVSAGGGFTRTGICTIVDMDSLEVEVDVNEAYIGRVAAGQRVEAVLDAYPDWRIPARVVAVVPTANRDKATIRVRIGFDGRDPRILPDMAAKVTFLEDRV
ncbi:efflux RND transporter periplasmic adaptor subunit [Rhodocista pekingensis]|uniref:Efflux RND transporter periplasmic adaptor subunit n=1 Tax=Rhodocista pekingensis TaxID=201185 RepID=A0ABW2L0D4_9PROT